ncbi:unnamed protein product [Prorocentrum cordatum]|uniref:Uncharacterized protein n=1 Tax=Prorocentrum cordatum TaxID=2364126 RepID=A0ABN9QPF3_9DINO|nr:unnamed protein product [Polarella glacialis]
MAPSAALMELLAGCPVAAGAFGAAAAAIQAGGAAKHHAALVAAAARGAVQAGSCATAVELGDGASGACALLKDMEEVLLAVERLQAAATSLASLRPSACCGIAGRRGPAWLLGSAG